MCGYEGPQVWGQNKSHNPGLPETDTKKNIKILK